MKRPGRILIASYHFPPDAAVGALRPARFARKLRELGWQPFVLTVNDGRRERLDLEGLVGLENVPVVKVHEPPSLLTTLNAARRGIRRLAYRRRPFGPTSTFAKRRGDALGKETLPRRLKRYFMSLVAFLPDGNKRWSFLASWRAVWMIGRSRIGYLLTSGPPASVHFIGVLAQALTPVRWIADFRDPWTESVAERSPRLRSRLADTIERRLERCVVSRADLVVTTNDRLADALRERYPSLPSARFLSIMNSIDTDRMPTTPVEKYSRFTITYAGTLYYGRTPEPLFQATRDLVADGSVASSDVRIKLVGDCKHTNGVETADLVKEYGLDDVVEILDPVPYSEALRIMQRSHLLLVLAPENHGLLVVAKVFDYLGSGSRLLALAEDGATADLVRGTGGGVCFQGSDVRGLRDYLRTVIEGGRYRELRNDPASFSAYAAMSMTRRLSDGLLALGTEVDQ